MEGKRRPSGLDLGFPETYRGEPENDYTAGNMTSAATFEIHLDVHAHLVPIAAPGIHGLPGVSWDAGRNVLEVDGKALAVKSLYEPRALIDWMDQNRIGRAWISIPPPMYRLEQDEAAARPWVERVNAGLGEIADRHRDRFDALFHLPVRHPELAAETARRHISAGGARFAMPAGSASHQVMLSDAAYEPLWRVLADGRAFLFLHPSSGCDVRLDRHSLQNLLGNPFEMAVAAAHLAMSGVGERFPEITFCLAHGGGVTGAVAGRLQRGRDTARPGIDTKVEPPRVAFKRFCVDCITHDPAGLELAAATFGHDHILFGSDWPFSMGLTEPQKRLSEFDEALARRIASDNPDELLRRLRTR
jgi:aminocarboxymuconate-semialdehyde decarboxylase